MPKTSAAAPASEKLALIDGVSLKVIKAGTISGAGECAICSNPVEFKNYPEGKKPVCINCMKDIADEMKGASTT